MQCENELKDGSRRRSPDVDGSFRPAFNCDQWVALRWRCLCARRNKPGQIIILSSPDGDHHRPGILRDVITWRREEINYGKMMWSLYAKLYGTTGTQGKFVKKPDSGWSSCQQLQKSWICTSSNMSRIQILNQFQNLLEENLVFLLFTSISVRFTVIHHN